MRRALLLATFVSALGLAAACSGTDARTGAGAAAPAPTAAPGTTTAAAPATGARSDRYADPAMWHCLPARADDLCDTTDLQATALSATGTEIVEPPSTGDPPVDCFYVYPTVDNTSPTPARTFDQPVNPLEAVVVQTTFAPYRGLCRQLAPRYEQVTGAGYRSPQAAELLAAGDAQVIEAFDHYLATENHGRPFVLIGHSQGTHHLVQLLRQRLDGDGGAPLRRQLVSALLLGPVGMVVTPAGRDVGGTFTSIPLCRSAEQTACVVAFDSYSAANPPQAGAPADGMERACTNPADLAAGAEPRTLHGAYLPRATAGVTTPTEIWRDYFQATCRRDAAGQPYLQIAAAPAPGDPRVDTVLERFGRSSLHVLDPNFAMADLLDLVARQAKAATG